MTCGSFILCSEANVGNRVILSSQVTHKFNRFPDAAGGGGGDRRRSQQIRPRRKGTPKKKSIKLNTSLPKPLGIYFEKEKDDAAAAD